MVIIVSIDMGRVGMGRVGMVLNLVAEFVMGRVCQGPSLSWAEFVMGRDVPESFVHLQLVAYRLVHTDEQYKRLNNTYLRLYMYHIHVGSPFILLNI